MSPIRRISSTSGLLILLLGLSLAGCGDPNSQVTYSPETGKHPANWVLAGHKSAALASGVDACSECHGSDFSGGISRVACSSCHLGGPTSIHPLEWGSGGVNVTNNHGAYLITHPADSCATVYCHGVNFEGGSGPACVACHN